MEEYIYFIISYPRSNKENSTSINILMPKNYKQNPKCIYSKENSANKEYNYIKIFKVSKIKQSYKKENKTKKYMFGFKSDKIVI